MSETPDTTNRLRDAVRSVAVPDGLADRIRTQMRAIGSGDEATERLRHAVRSVEVPPFLEARIRNHIRTQKPSRWWVPRLLPVAVAAAVVVGLSIAYQLGHLRLTVRSQESYISSVSSQVATLMRVGLGDHIHCSVFRKYPTNPPTTEQFLAKINPQYSGLIPIVRSEVPDTYRMMLAHECKYHGRKFIHLSLMNDSNLLSLVITRKGEGESFKTEDMLPAFVQSGIPMYQSGTQRFQITAFETNQYLVYFISDLGKKQNTDLMLALAPRVKEFLARQETL